MEESLSETTTDISTTQPETRLELQIDKVGIKNAIDQLTAGKQKTPLEEICELLLQDGTTPNLTQLALFEVGETEAFKAYTSQKQTSVRIRKSPPGIRKDELLRKQVLDEIKSRRPLKLDEEVLIFRLVDIGLIYFRSKLE